MGNDNPTESGGTAVWYFVGATFLFAGSTFLGSPTDDGGASPFGIIAGLAGVVVLVAGIWVFARENKGRRK